MLPFFRYNWMVRDEWFELLQQVPHDELVRKWTGGLGNILKTFFHIVDVEQAWIRGLQKAPEFHFEFSPHTTLEQVKQFSDNCRPEIEKFVQSWTPDMEMRILSGVRINGQPFSFRWGEVMRHVIAHEIHHIGQLSVWARELGLEPVSANVIRRGLFDGQPPHA